MCLAQGPQRYDVGELEVDNHIPRDDIFDYHPLRECNIYIVLVKYGTKYTSKFIWYITKINLRLLFLYD